MRFSYLPAVKKPRHLSLTGRNIKYRTIVDTLKARIAKMYGEDVQNHLNVVLNVGDIVENGNTLPQFLSQYFNPIINISANIPAMNCL